MVMLGGTYDGEESTFEPIPPGEYLMHIVASEMVTTKDGRGRFLKLDMEVLEGTQAGRKISERLNLENPNAQAVEIAQRTLKSIIFATGLSSCSDSEKLHMRRMSVRLNVKERNDKPGVMSNEIAGYKQVGASSGNSASAASSGAAGQSRPAPAIAAGDSAPPWKRG